MNWVISKKGIAVIGLIGAFIFALGLSGAFGDTRIGITLLSNQNLSNGLIAHYTFDGEFEQGTFEFGSGGATTTDLSANADVQFKVVKDSSGYMYVTGDCDGCGPHGGQAHYTYKINPLSGDVVWATTTDPSSGNERALSITIDQSNYLYVTGGCDSGCGTNGGSAHYTYKIDSSDGAMVWATSTDPTSGADVGGYITVDRGNNLYAVGSCTSCGGNGGTAYYLYKMDAQTGGMLWATSTDPGPNNDTVIDIVTDASGDVYVTGNCFISCGATLNYFTYKADKEDGSMLWATTTTPVSSTNGPNAMIIDERDRMFIAGYCNPCGNQGSTALYVFEINPNNGDMLWATTTDPTSSGDSATGIYSDSNGSIYVSGYCNGCAEQGLFASYTYKASADDGSLIWATTTDPSSGSDSGEDLILSDDDNLLVFGACSDCGPQGGSTYYTMKLDPNDGSMIDTTSTDALQNVGGKKVGGNIGQGLKFDDTDDRVRAADSSQLQPGSSADWSVALWAKPPDGPQRSPLINKREVTGNFEQWTLEICGDTGCGTDGQQLNALFRQSNAVERRAFSDDDIADGEWHHYVMVADQTFNNIRLYMDGVELSTTLTTDGGWPTVDNPEDLLIGDSASSEQEFNGEIDDVRIYNRSLSPSEITRLYELGATTKINKTLDTNPDLKDGLVTHYTFDGTNANNVFTDYGSNGADGYIGLTDAVFMATTVSSGVMGQGIYLDGEDVSWIEGDTIDSMTSMTVCTWFKLDALINDGGETTFNLLNKRSSFRLDIFPPGQAFYQFETSAVHPAAQSKTNFYPDQWYHICAVNEGIGISPRVYIDGVDDTTNNGGGSGTADDDTDSGAILDIGAAFDNPYAYNFPGVMDDIRVYNRALGTSTIKRIYELGATTKINKTIDTNPDLNRGLLTHYTFDGGMSNVFNDTGTLGNTAELVSGAQATNTVPGNLGQGISLSGLNNDALAGDTQDNLATSTYCMWVRADSFTNPDSDTRVIMIDKGIEMNLNNAGRAVFWRSTDGSFPQVSSSVTLNIMDWHHICGIYNGIGIAPEIYVDGVNRSQGQITGAGTNEIDDSALVLRIGSSVGNTFSNNFDGALDDIRVYDRPLLDEEILRLYQLGN